jgi:hypothetical protein
MNALHALAMTNPSEAAGWVGSWSPGIGDPTFIGWFTVVAYAAATFLCFRLRKRFSPDADSLRRQERRFWGAMTAILLFLCVNKQLDLQTAMTEFFRGAARREGWYGQRAKFQIAFIAAMALALPITACLLLGFLRRLPRSTKHAGLGLILLGIFVLIRAASFHHIDQILGSRVLLLRTNWILELGGIAIILISGRRRWRELNRGPHARSQMASPRFPSTKT